MGIEGALNREKLAKDFEALLAKYDAQESDFFKKWYAKEGTYNDIPEKFTDRWNMKPWYAYLQYPSLTWKKFVIFTKRKSWETSISV